jgi:SPP1 family predicted phage head-tail adaptor
VLRAGSLRHRVILQRPVETQNSVTGEMNIAWEDVATLWASIEPISAREFIAAQVEHSKVTTRITIRYRKNINPNMRLYHRAKQVYYNIHGILSDKESGFEYLTLPCSEGVRYYVDSDCDIVMNGDDIVFNGDEIIVNCADDSDCDLVMNGAYFVMNGAFYVVDCPEECDVVMNGVDLVMNGSDDVVNCDDSECDDVFNGADIVMNGVDSIVNCPTYVMNGSDFVYNGENQVTV